MFQLTLWCLPPLIAVLVSVGTYMRIRKSTEVPGVSAFLLLLAAVIFWACCDFADAVSTSYAAKLIAYKLSYCGIVLTPVAWFLFALTFTNRQLRAHRNAFRWLTIIPLLTVAMVVTNEYHGFIWRTVSLTISDDYAGLITTHGNWFYVHSVYSYSLIIFATTILVFGLSQSSNTAKPIIAVIAAPIIVGCLNAFSLSDLNPLPWFDLSTIGFALASIVLNNGVLKYGLLDARPVLRGRVVEKLSDAVIVVNPAGRIVDSNPAALSILGVSRMHITNTHITEHIKTMPLMELKPKQQLEGVEITLNNHAYHITSTKLDDSVEHSEQVFVFRDVTERHQADRMLRQVKSELERLAHTDGLTGLDNRRFFTQRLDEEIERVRRHGSTLSVLIFDLDHFKLINDTHGHDVGDRVLVNVAEVATNIKRVTDVVARIGGEEFAFLLPETQQEGAMMLADRLRQSIEDMRTRAGNNTLKVTASVGVATITQGSRDLEKVLKQADKALYKAKDGGRNRVISAANVA